MAHQNLTARILQDIDDLPPMPATASRVLAMVGDPRTDVGALAEAVGSDIALAARVLKLANSAFYGFPRQVTTLREAIMILGMRGLKELVITAWSYDLGNRPLPGYALEGGELWRHSLLCAAGCRLLAKQLGFENPEEAYAAGLLHDFGKLVLAQFVGQEYHDLLEKVEGHGLSFVEAERQILGVDHAHLGGQLALKWNLPLHLAEAVAHHHQPTTPGAPAVAKLTALVHVVDAVTLMLGIGVGADGLAYPLEQAALDALGLTDQQVLSFASEMSSLMESLRFEL